MLFYTGVARYAHQILDEQIERTQQGVITDDLRALSDLVDQGLDVLINNHPLADFGELLHCAWLTKRRLSSKISTCAIDEYYERARRAGAIGGKLLGAGGGGFLLLMADPIDQPAIERALGELRRVNFGFDHSGSALMFYQPVVSEVFTFA
jgi:D-glycero-alpha-D-manno-heptose-7-phosphate kinase